MDKRRTLDALAATGLAVPQGCALQHADSKWINIKNPDQALSIDDAMSEVRFLPPWFVKPNCGGSSVGVTIVKTAEELDDALIEAAKVDDLVLIETYISGVEVTCGVLEQWDAEQGRSVATALPPTQIVPRHAAFFDYKSKYTAGETMEITPANLEPEILARIQETALAAHRTLGCRGFSRTDMIVQDGIPFVLELNTIPGMTPTSLFPQGAAAMGLDFPDLLDELIATALISARAQIGVRRQGS